MDRKPPQREEEMSDGVIDPIDFHRFALSSIMSANLSISSTEHQFSYCGQATFFQCHLSPGGNLGTRELSVL